jgi:hypothetical protein
MDKMTRIDDMMDQALIERLSAEASKLQPTIRRNCGYNSYSVEWRLVGGPRCKTVVLYYDTNDSEMYDEWGSEDFEFPSIPSARETFVLIDSDNYFDGIEELVKTLEFYNIDYSDCSFFKSHLSEADNG